MTRYLKYPLIYLLGLFTGLGGWAVMFLAEMMP